MGLKQYPLVYSTNARTQRAIIAIGLAPLGLIIAISVLAIVGLVDKAITPLGMVVPGVLAGLFALFVSRWTCRRVFLYEDGIEVSGLFSARKLKRSEILGRRMEASDSAYGGSHYVIVPMNMAVRVLRLPPYLSEDKDFQSWMDGIPKIAKGRAVNP